MRQRTISDYFWRDPKLCNLTQEDRATLLFFLTSPWSNIIGVYQVVWAIAGAELGWTKDQLLGVAKRLRNRGLINFSDGDDGWIFVKVWWEHNSALGAFSPKLVQNAKKQCDAMPSEWLDEFLTLIDSLNFPGLNRVSIGYPYPIDTLQPNTTTTTGISIPSTTTTTPETSTSIAASSCIVELIYPQLSLNEKKSIEGLIRSLSPDVRQPILDELAGAINKQTISKGVIGYMNGLSKAVKKGTFIPNLGIAVLDARQRIKEAHDREILAKSELKLGVEKNGPGRAMYVASKKKGNQTGNSRRI